MSTWKFLCIVLLAVTMFSAVYFPVEVTLIHGVVVMGSTILLGLLGMSIASELRKLKEERTIKQTIRQAYTKFAAERGELFDRSDVDMNDTDRAQVKGRIRILFVLAMSSVLFFSVVGYFAGGSDHYLFLILIVLIAAFSVYMYFQYKRILKCNFKTVVRGVLTDKRRLDDGDNVEYDFEVSNKEWIPVRSSDYKRFTLGDIIEIQMLSGLNSLALKNEISLVGKMDQKIGQ